MQMLKCNCHLLMRLSIVFICNVFIRCKVDDALKTAFFVFFVIGGWIPAQLVFYRFSIISLISGNLWWFWLIRNMSHLMINISNTSDTVCIYKDCSCNKVWHMTTATFIIIHIINICKAERIFDILTLLWRKGTQEKGGAGAITWILFCCCCRARVVVSSPAHLASYHNHI